MVHIVLERTAPRPPTDLVAKTEVMKRLLVVAARVAETSAPILLVGESGTGKERLARYVHERSLRAKGPFLAVNCAALPESLLESELFGHEKGAFTGADRRHRGLFEAAERGTLFLDEVAEMPLGVQVKLLRVLEDHEIRRVGASTSRQVDVRIVAATNRDLEEMVRERSFRRDLYYRLKVVMLEIPPLRERRDDILALAHTFVRRGCATYSCGPCSLSAQALDRLLGYPWPGNVRELGHALERAVVLAEGKPKIGVDDLPPEIASGHALPAAPGSTMTLAELERAHILAILERCAGNRRETAQRLGIGTNTLWRKLRQYGVSEKSG
jgi:DNA-binding NtrC family response regulator